MLGIQDEGCNEVPGVLQYGRALETPWIHFCSWWPLHIHNSFTAAKFCCPHIQLYCCRWVVTYSLSVRDWALGVRQVTVNIGVPSIGWGWISKCCEERFSSPQSKTGCCCLYLRTAKQRVWGTVSFLKSVLFIRCVCEKEGTCAGVCSGQSEELVSLQGYSPDYQLQACQAPFDLLSLLPGGMLSLLGAAEEQSAQLGQVALTSRGAS